MNLKNLGTFVVTVDVGHVGRAAKQLGITQPAVTQQMHSLENEIGFRLFQRQGRSVILTAAGVAFLPHARSALLSAEAAIAAGLRANRGDTGRLLVGYCHSSMFEPELPELIRVFSLQWPDIHLEMRDVPVLQQIEDLCMNRLDLAFARPPIGVGAMQNKLRIQPFSATRLEAVLPDGHPAAGQAEVDMRDLAGERFLLLNEPDGVGLRSRVIDICREADFEPGFINASTNLTSIVSMVAAGLGITLTPSNLRCLHFPGVKFVPLSGVNTTSELALISRLDETSGITLRFIEQVWARQFSAAGSRPTTHDAISSTPEI